MAMCEHDPQHAEGKCPNMTHQQFHDFAATPRKGLPERAASSEKYSRVGSDSKNGKYKRVGE